MIPYFLVLFSVLLFVIFEKFYLGRKAIIAPMFFLVALSSLRRNSVGVDSRTYTLSYMGQYNPYEYGFDPNVEYGYQFLDSFILDFTYNYFWLFFITSIITISLYLYTIKKQSIDYSLSVFIFITFGFYTFFFNGLRQGIAMAFSFYALNFLQKRQFIKYFIIICVAASFHKSALIMLFVYLLVVTRINFIVKFFGCLILSLLTSSFIINYLAENNTRYELYSQKTDELGGVFTILFYLLLGLFICLIGRIYLINNKFYQDLLTIYCCGVALILPLTFLGVDPSGPQRLLYYFVSTSILLLPFIFKEINSKVIYSIFIILCIVYFYMITFNLSGLYPYILNPIFEIF